jgi:hypothetical protein
LAALIGDRQRVQSVERGQGDRAAEPREVLLISDAVSARGAIHALERAPDVPAHRLTHASIV